MTPNAVDFPARSTGNMPITSALYGRKQRTKRKPQRRTEPVRHTFRVADQLSPETRQALAALQGRLEKKAAGRKRRRRSRPKAVTA